MRDCLKSSFSVRNTQCPEPAELDSRRVPSAVGYTQVDLTGGRFQILIAMIATRSRKPIGTQARTGESCPESGVWKVVGYPTTTAPIAQGNRMPPYDGKAVTWELTQYA